MRELTCFPLLERFEMTSGYGVRIDPITEVPGKMHWGVDYGAPYGAPVVAPFGGDVVTGYEDGAGNWSWVTAGDDLFKSFHHSSCAVRTGWVAAGTTIAFIGSTGSSTGSHAHLELWECGVNIDPTGYLDRAPLWTGDEDVPLSQADLDAIARICDQSIHRALAANYTGSRALQIQGDPEVYQLVWKSGELCKRHIPRPTQVGLLQYVDGIAGERGQPPRMLTDPNDIAEFHEIPLVA